MRGLRVLGVLRTRKGPKEVGRYDWGQRRNKERLEPSLFRHPYLLPLPSLYRTSTTDSSVFPYSRSSASTQVYNSTRHVRVRDSKGLGVTLLLVGPWVDSPTGTSIDSTDSS